MNSKQFFGQWVGALFAAMLVATIGAFASMWTVGAALESLAGETVGVLTAGAIFGGLLALGIGVGQGVVLRRHGVAFGRWVWHTTLAGTVGMALSFPVMFTLFDAENMPEVAAGTAIALGLGLPIGIVQAQLLKGHVPAATRWIAVCVVAFVTAFAVGLPLGGEGREWLAMGTVALLTALLTGAGILYLLRDTQSVAPA